MMIARCPVLLMVTLALGACDDPTTAPVPRPTADRVADSGRPERFPGSVKYRDTGHQPATGRAGGATITARALLDRRGVADVEVYAGALGGTGPGELSKVQLKRFTLAGEHVATENHNDLATRAIVLPLRVVERNTPIQVQANVRGAAGPRTGVVTVSDVVKLRPDLTVLGITAPSTGPTGVPIHIDAVVQEVNGDVGARANCGLDVDGVPVDSAPGIWVDAGGMVTCEFVHVFTEPGAHALRVRVTGVEPGDYDTANDQAEATIALLTERLFTSWFAEVTSLTFNVWSERSWHLVPGGGAHEGWRYRSDRRGTWQSASLEAYINHPISFPAQPLTNVVVSQATGGATVHAATYPVLAPESSSIGDKYSRWCVLRASSGEVVAEISICTFRDRSADGETWWTRVAYDWDAGDVTYQSLENHYLQCLGGAMFCAQRGYPPYASWGWNTTDRTVAGRMVTFGSDYVIAVALESGAERYSVEAAIPLSYTRTSSGSPLRCRWDWMWSVPYSIFGFGNLETCEGNGDESWGQRGFVINTSLTP